MKWTQSSKYGTVQLKCKGGMEHDDEGRVYVENCPGGEWRDFMSLGWIADDPEAAIDIMVSSPEEKRERDEIRITRTLEYIYEGD